MMIEGNGVTISENYKSHWYPTNYAPSDVRLYTNHQNNKFNWNGGTFTDDYHGHWFATNYTPAGVRLYANYANNTWSWNGGTFTDHYTTHWYATSYAPADVRLYTNYTNDTWNWNGGTFTDNYTTHWFTTNYTPAGSRLYVNYANNTWSWNGGTFTDNYTTHWFNTGRSYTVTSYYKGGYKETWKVAAYDPITLYTNYNNTRTRTTSLASWKWNGSETVVDLPYTHPNLAYLHQVWVNDTYHRARTDCQAYAGWANRNDRKEDKPYTIYNTLGNPPIVLMYAREPEEDGVVRRYLRISDGATINTGCDFIRFSGSPLITSF